MTHNSGVFLTVVLLEFFELEVFGPYDLAKVRGKLLQTRRAVGSIIFHTAIAFVGCTIVGSLVNAIAFSEGMAEIAIAITTIPIATLVNPATTVITAIITVVSAVVAPVVVAVIVPTTIMATVSALTVV